MSYSSSARDLDRRGQPPEPVAVDHDPHPRTDRLADPPDRLDPGPQLVGVDREPDVAHPGRVERPELHRRDALIEQRVRELLRRVVPAPQVLQSARPATDLERRPTVLGSAARVVDRQAVARTAAQQFEDRAAGRLPEDVPQRGIDGGDRADLDARASEPGRIAIVERGPEPLDLRRVLTEQLRRGPLVKIAADRRGHHERVAGADETLIGLDPNVEDVRGVGEVDRLDAGDPHPRGAQPVWRVASALLAAAMVASMSASVCAADMNHVPRLVTRTPRS